MQEFLMSCDNVFSIQCCKSMVYRYALKNTLIGNFHSDNLSSKQRSRLFLITINTTVSLRVPDDVINRNIKYKVC